MHLHRNNSKPAPPAAQLENPRIIENIKRDSPGRTTVKRYQKGPLLGEGARAKIFLFTDMDTMEDWACKVIQKSSLTKQRNQDLQSEIEILRSISHRHVVSLEDVFEDKESVYIIMELCPNQTMLELVKCKKRFIESDARRYMLQVLDAVRHMHQRNIIHRDLKLGNFFLGKNGEIKVGDFGFACKLKFDGERKTTRCGTPNYVAPEMLDGKGHSFEVDVWSIGVVLYTCLVGKPPFETSDKKLTFRLIRTSRCEVSVSVSAC
jgi:polo-like kinase 1